MPEEQLILLACCCFACVLALLGVAFYFAKSKIAATTSPSGAKSEDSATTPPGPAGSARTTTKICAPYIQVSPRAVQSMGSGGLKWYTLAFVTGYDAKKKKIQWDSGATIPASSIKAKGQTLKDRGGGLIVSFGGESAGGKGTKGFGELAGSYRDPVELADAYISVADALGSVRLDFDVEVSALTDTKSVTIRNAALALLQKKRPDISISFTVPVEANGLETITKSMLLGAKSAGVRIGTVNVMAMYFTTKKTDMVAAAMKALEASKSFITGLGATAGVTPQIGKNPDKPYTHEEFTVSNATALVSAAKKDATISLLSFWSVDKDRGGAFSKAFMAYS